MVDLRETATGVRVPVTVQARASKTEVVGEHGDTLKIRIAAPPVDGAANQELIDVLSKALKIPKRSIEIVSGEKSRSKRVRIAGAERDAVLKAFA